MMAEKLDYSLVSAKMSDFDTIMNEVSKGVYSGLDYLTHCYKVWIEEEKSEKSKRSSFGKCSIRMLLTSCSFQLMKFFTQF